MQSRLPSPACLSVQTRRPAYTVGEITNHSIGGFDASGLAGDISKVLLNAVPGQERRYGMPFCLKENVPDVSCLLFNIIYITRNYNGLEKAQTGFSAAQKDSLGHIPDPTRSSSNPIFLAMSTYTVLLSKIFLIKLPLHAGCNGKYQRQRRDHPEWTHDDRQAEIKRDARRKEHQFGQPPDLVDVRRLPA